MVACWASTVASGCTLSTVARTVAVLYVVAFLDVEVGDAAEGGGADVDVGLGLDLAGAADDGDEILADDLAGGDLGDAGLAVKRWCRRRRLRGPGQLTTMMMIFLVLIQLLSSCVLRVERRRCAGEVDACREQYARQRCVGSVFVARNWASAFAVRQYRTIVLVDCGCRRRYLWSCFTSTHDDSRGGRVRTCVSVLVSGL